MSTNELPLLPPEPPSLDVLAKARAAMQAEVKAPRAAGWKALVVRMSGTLLGLFAVLVGALLAVGACTVDLLSTRSVTLTALMTVGLVSTWASLRPRGVLGRWVSVGLVTLTAGLLVLLRGAGAPSLQPQWVCTVSHLGVGLVPSAIVILLLRNMAPSRLRSFVAGLAAGTTGAFAGELACGQSAQHVALFHLSAWVAVGLFVTFLSSKLTPRSYAP